MLSLCLSICLSWWCLSFALGWCTYWCPAHISSPAASKCTGFDIRGAGTCARRCQSCRSPCRPHGWCTRCKRAGSVSPRRDDGVRPGRHHAACPKCDGRRSWRCCYPWHAVRRCCCPWHARHDCPRRSNSDTFWTRPAHRRHYTDIRATYPGSPGSAAATGNCC